MNANGDLPEPPEPFVVGPLTRTDFVRYQGASGDMYPIHHDEPYATEQARLPSVISLGMLNAGVLATWATNWLGPENVRQFRVRFCEPVWPGDTLTCTGGVERVYEEEGERRVDVELHCTRQNGALAVQGWATFVVDDTPERT